MSELPYRVAPPKPPDPYLEAWEELERRRIRRWVVFLAWGPLALLSGALVHWIAGSEMIVGATPIWLGAVGLMIYYGNFKCPRCGESFERRPLRGNPWTQRCMNCDLQRGTPKGDGHTERG